MAKYVFLALVCIPSTVLAQADRYELGQRLRAFEKTWQATVDAEARQRALTPLNKAVQSFFSFNFSGVADYLDQARHALLWAERPSSQTRWSDALAFRPEQRFFDAKSQQLRILVSALYSVANTAPQEVSIRMRLGDHQPAEFCFSELPHTCTLPLVRVKSGDYLMTIETAVGGERTGTREIMVSCAEDLQARLEALKPIAQAASETTTMERATLVHLYEMIAELASGSTMETDIPAARLLREAEALAGAISEGRPYYGVRHSGQFWLRIPIGKSYEVVRVLIPPGLEQHKLVPVVIALHGAGGSENLFFDGYGNGITARLCEERGWVMVAPRAGGLLGFGGAPNVVKILDELATRYPIDKQRAYLIGHSMGARHALAVAQQNPERFAGVAILGGGGALQKPESIRSMSIFVGVGKHDFALQLARGLARKLEREAVGRMLVKEYENVEHMMIVQEAAPDVFRFWENN